MFAAFLFCSSLGSVIWFLTTREIQMEPVPHQVTLEVSGAAVAAAPKKGGFCVKSRSHVTSHINTQNAPQHPARHHFPHSSRSDTAGGSNASLTVERPARPDRFIVPSRWKRYKDTRMFANKTWSESEFPLTRRWTSKPQIWPVRRAP